MIRLALLLAALFGSGALCSAQSEAPPDWIKDVAWHPSGEIIASASLNGSVQVWDANGVLIRDYLPLQDRPSLAVAWRPDGQFLAAANHTTLYIWRMGDPDPVLIRADYPETISGLAWHPAENILAVTSEQKPFFALVNAETGDIVQAFRPSSVIFALDWNPVQSEILTGGYRGVSVWDAASENMAYGLPDMGISYAVAWRPDGARFALGKGQSLQIWDAAHLVPVTTLSADASPVAALDWSPDGAYLVSASLDGEVRIWDAASGALLQAYGGPMARHFAVGWHPTQNRIVYGGQSDRVTVVDLLFLDD